MNNEGAHLPRIETKFVVDASSYHQLRTWMHVSPAAFRPAFPPRQVNNVYFDSFELDSLERHLAGMSVRSKLRYRWYGADAGIHGGALELKFKRDRLRWKSCVDRPQISCTGREPWRHIIGQLARGLAPEHALWLHSRPVPAVINTYQRAYFVTADGRLRATIDTDLRVAVQRGGSRPHWKPSPLSSDDVVLELKFPPELLDYVNRLSSTLPLRPDRHSKYVKAFG